MRQFGLILSMILIKEVCFPNNCCYRNRLKAFFSIVNEKCFKRKKTDLQILILHMQSTTDKIKLIGYLILYEIKPCNLKHFEEKSQRNLKNITILNSMTTLNNVPLKIEIAFGLQGFNKAIIKTTNGNDKS